MSTEEPVQLPEAETYVLSVPDRLSDAENDAWRRRWAEGMPGKRLIVLAGGAKIEPLGWQESFARIEALLERIAEAIEHTDEFVSRQAALEAWAMGQGKHPDD